MVSLKYLSNFWRTREMTLINCETTRDLNWSEKSVIAATNIAKQGTTLSITNTKFYVTLSIKDKSKLLEQSKSDFQITINWNKYQL